MSNVQCEEKLQSLWEGQRLLSDKISNLTMISDDSQLMLRQVGEKQAQFVKAASDIAEMQKRLVQGMAGTTGVADLSTFGDDGDENLVDAIRDVSPSPSDAPSRNYIEAIRDGSPSPSPSDAPSRNYVKAIRDSSPSPPDAPSRNYIEAILRRDSTEDHFDEERHKTDTAWWDWGASRRSLPFNNLVRHEPMPRYGGLPPAQWVRVLARRILSEPLFDYIVGLAILANAVCIGLELDMELRNENTSVFVSLEYCFVCFYVFELVLRFIAHGVRCLRSGWVFTDFVLVLLGSVSLFLVPLVVASVDKHGADSDVTTVPDQILILRMARFVRLARTLRIFSMFKSLWRLVVGFVHSFTTIFSTVVLLMIIIYVFACIGVELITKDRQFMNDAAVAAIVTKNFSTVPSIMLTLIQLATLDSIAGIYYPLIMANPWLALYFIPILLILSVAVMNLVTALIVEDALKTTALDNESRAISIRRKLKRIIPVVKRIFTELDTSNDGCIDTDEIVSNIEMVQARMPPHLASLLAPDKLVDLFDFLDVDGSGKLSEDEFVDGVCHLILTTVPVETTQMLQLLRHNRREIGAVRKDLKKLKGRATNGRTRYSIATSDLAARADFERLAAI